MLVAAFAVFLTPSVRSQATTGLPRPALLELAASEDFNLAPGQQVTLATAALQSGADYSFEISLADPGSLTPRAELTSRGIASPITFNVVPAEIYQQQPRLTVSIALPGDPVVAKGLHAGDPGMYTLLRALQTGPGSVTLRAASGADLHPLHVRLALRPVKEDGADSLQLVPNTARDWQHAAPMQLGKTVFGAADDIEYLYNTQEGKTGWQWLTFDVPAGKPQLVFFELDILDRDIPVNLKLYRQEDGPDGRQLVEYKRGSDPTEIRHDDQADELVGFKFLSRVITPGRYFLSVKANHPQWSLRTHLFDVPPYSDPRRAAEVAMRYLVDIGDSFFSNIPRKGAVRTRAENVTDETERCLTCHPAHFTMLATLTAVRHGYTVANSPEFKFMVDRLYNAPAPFYGFPGTYWMRWDLAPANSISRLGEMLSFYEDSVSHRLTETPGHTAGYLRLAYDARSRLPRADAVHYMDKFQPTKTRNFEFDGNRPISDFRVATDSWYVLDRLARLDHDGAMARSAAHLKTLLTSTSTNDLEDLVEQTKGLVLTHDPAFQPLIRANVAKILARQHTDGGWVTAEYMSNEQFFDAAVRAPFEKPSDPSLQFMTGEVLYTLSQAGENPNDPRVQKALHWLLARQRDFGGWLDNKGELFLMPHLETSWAVMGLAQMFPEHGGPVVAAPPAPTDLGRVPVDQLRLAPTLDWLDQLWYHHDAATVRAVLPLLRSREPMLRAAAAAALGRMAVDAPDAAAFDVCVPPLAHLLADPNKLVNGAAAWSLRQLGNLGLGVDAVRTALDSRDDYARRGAARVFYQYWYHMTDREDMARDLVRHVSDPDMLVRIEALKSLWRWWYRTPDFALRRQIEGAFLQAAGRREEHPLVRLNVAQAIYNILDENTVQFHKNWLRTLPLQADRDRAEAARISEVERPLARELSSALSGTNVAAQQTVLTALDYYFLRGGIGNDYDPITFYDRSAAETMAHALLPLLRSPDPVIAGKAMEALAVAREARDPQLLLAVIEHLKSSDPHLREVAEEELSRIPTQYAPGSAWKAEASSRPSGGQSTAVPAGGGHAQ